MESMHLKIEKLRDGDNWLQWRFVIRTLLEENNDTLSVREGGLERPAENSANCEINLQKFLRADKTARRLIVTSVEKNLEFHQRSKHIDIKYHFVRDLYEKGEIDVKYVRNEEQIANIFTKALAKLRYLYLSKKLGLISKKEITE